MASHQPGQILLPNELPKKKKNFPVSGFLESRIVNKGLWTYIVSLIFLVTLWGDTVATPPFQKRKVRHREVKK